MREQRRLHLRAADVVASRNDHVVGACGVIEITVGIHAEGITGDVPAVLHILALAAVGQIATTGRPFHCQPSHHARRTGLALFIQHRGDIAGDGMAGGTASRRLLGMRNEDVDHLGRAHAVQDLDAGGLFPQLPCGIGQGFAG